MKKLIIAALALVSMTAAQAQIADDKNNFNHLSASVGVGTTGISLEVGTVASSHIGLRAGVDFMPSVTVHRHFDYVVPSELKQPAILSMYDLPQSNAKVDTRSTLNMVHGKLLVDYFPAKNGQFHLTAGFYLGGSTMASMKASDKIVASYEEYKNDIAAGKIQPENPPVKVDFEGYEVTPNKGRMELDYNTWAVKPYIGIGFGRTVPRKRVGCKFELGVLFWGKHEVVDHYGNNGKGYTITKDEKGISKDFHDVLKTLDKIPVYPNLKISIVGRIF